MSIKKKSNEVVTLPSGFTSVPSPVENAFILVCEKCGKKLSDDPDKNPARVLQGTLKEMIKGSGQKGVVRAVITSCLDICPAKEIAVGVAKANSVASQFFTVEPKNIETLAKQILDVAASACENPS